MTSRQQTHSASRRFGLFASRVWRLASLVTSSPRQTLVLTALLVLLVSAFSLGGSSRGDAAFLTILRPVSVLCLGVACLGLERRHLVANGTIVGIAVAAIALPALQLVPLPPQVWQSLPGRDLVAQIDVAAGLGSIWRPLTFTPPETLNALLSGLVPLGVILLAIQLPRTMRVGLLVLPLAFGAIGAFLGLAQMLGDPYGPLYFYEFTNNGSPVGWFANRNHQAVALACMLPLSFAATCLKPLVRPWQASATSPRLRVHMAVAAACLVVPLVMITGSRAGLIAAGLALASLALVMPAAARDSGRRGVFGRVWLLLLGLPIGLGAVSIWLGRDLALDRLVSLTPADDLRFQIVPTLGDMFERYWMLGTGFGSFERIYKVHEPADLLTPTYANHAHNDWLELTISGGLPGLILLSLALAGLAGRAVWVFGPQGADDWQPLRVAALACVLLLALASFSDYPLRTPHLAAFFALNVVWLFLPTAGEAEDDSVNLTGGRV